MIENVVDLLWHPHFHRLVGAHIELDLPAVGLVRVDQKRMVVWADLAHDLDREGFDFEAVENYLGQGWYIVKEVDGNGGRIVAITPDYDTAKTIAECDEEHRDIWRNGKFVSW